MAGWRPAKFATATARERGGGGRTRRWKGGGRTPTVGARGYCGAAASFVPSGKGFCGVGRVVWTLVSKALRPRKIFFFLSEHLTAHKV